MFTVTILDALLQTFNLNEHSFIFTIDTRLLFIQYFEHSTVTHIYIFTIDTRLEHSTVTFIYIFTIDTRLLLMLIEDFILTEVFFKKNYRKNFSKKQ